MAQAFEIPVENSYGKPDSATGPVATAQSRPSSGAKQRFPDRRSRSDPAAGGNWNMGSVSDRRKRINAALPRPVTGPIPGSAIRARLIVSGGFDKGTRLPV